ncbi:unnamed protein product, partial [Discosporangium mesarthrocarpum]
NKRALRTLGVGMGPEREILPPSRRGELEASVDDTPLLDSVRSLVDKERALGLLKVEEKELEAKQWKRRYLELQNELKLEADQKDDGSPEDGEGVGGATSGQLPQYTLGQEQEQYTLEQGPSGEGSQDWDYLCAAQKQKGDTFLAKLRQQERLDLSRQ